MDMSLGNPLQPEKSHRQRSLMGYSSWGHKESDMTEHALTHFLYWTKILLLFLPTDASFKSYLHGDYLWRTMSEY